ncbi:hypothetical protein [Parendozoicomonas sp. Alg238-R29]|uniref:hypothetical protein n=1 Tax=Parendozoicomonas sp. Alg238-R29 TaxID=2993446 RepID=UPI00248ECCB9|nr:hypothetical protein [Parendozoicomonas sp. Alg238-R29]
MPHILEAPPFDGTGVRIELPADLDWQNEFDWSPIAQNTDRSASGANIIQQTRRHYGQPVELSSGRDWDVDRAKVIAVKQLEESALPVKLTLADGRVLFCVFDRAGGIPVDAKSMWAWRNGEALPDDHPYSLTVRLLTIEPPEAPAPSS